MTLIAMTARARTSTTILACFAAIISALLVAVASPSNATHADAPRDCADARAATLLWLVCETANLAVTTQNTVARPELGPGIAAATFDYQQERRRALASDPERRPDLNACSIVVICLVDPRLTDWESLGGDVQPVLYTSRSGATMSGNIWSFGTSADRRPGIVVTNGSIIGYEQAYWFLAQSLARAGFLVMTFDVQGEGMSDQFGEAPDQREDAFAGMPLLGLLGPRPVSVDVFGGNGLPFYDGTQDALDFLLSSPAEPYDPRPSRLTGTSHDSKQLRRVREGLNDPYNPAWRTTDEQHIGLIGHSYGAQAASWLAQADPRVDAAVALDSLCVPVSPPVDEALSLGSPASDFGGFPYVTYGFDSECFSTPNGKAPPVTKPVLGIAGDYLLTPIPYLVPPDPLAKARASFDYSASGTDTGQIVIRGGTHLSFVDLPTLAPGALRAIDLTTWYSIAWFQKYLAGYAAADAMLFTDRWRNDSESGAIDPRGDRNLLSWHFRSRLAVTSHTGAVLKCEDLRRGCSNLVAPPADGRPEAFSMLIATGRPD